MIPILYPENETNFTSNGLGRLSDAISCIVTEEANGIFELNMSYPLDGIHVDDLEVNRIIYARPSMGTSLQPFRIKTIERSWGNRISIVARHFCYDLSDYPCSEFGQTNVVPYKQTPVLYSASRQVIGTLTDLVSYNITKAGNIYTLTLIYPNSGTYSSQITTACYIYVQPEINKSPQLFDITNIVIGSTRKTITATATEQSQGGGDLNQMNVVEALARIHQGAEAYGTFPFTFSAVPDTAGDTWATTDRTFWNEAPVSTKEILSNEDERFVSVFGGEWEWDHYNCIFHEHRGVESGVIYKFGKNITDIKSTNNIDDFYTHVFSYWKGTRSSSTNTNQSDDDYTNYYVKTGTVIKASSNTYDQKFPYRKTLYLDASSEFEEEPSTQQLDDYTNWYIEQNEVGIPRVSITVDVVDLASTEEYKNYAPLETVHLCDYVTVMFPMFGVDVKEQISKIEYNVLTDKNQTITIGETKLTLADTIASNKRNIRKSKYDNQKWADKCAERATRASNGWYGGNIKQKYNSSDHKQQELLVMDSDNEDTAGHVLKADGGGISGSSSGSKGTYDAIIALRNNQGNIGVNGSMVNFGVINSQSAIRPTSMNLETGLANTFNAKTTAGEGATVNDVSGNFVSAVVGLMKIIGALGIAPDSISEGELADFLLYVKGRAKVKDGLGVGDNITVADLTNLLLLVKGFAKINNGLAIGEGATVGNLAGTALYVAGNANVTGSLIVDGTNVKEALGDIPPDVSADVADLAGQVAYIREYLGI